MIAIGADHAAYTAKEQLKEYLLEQGYQLRDYGCDSDESVHYPLYGAAVARAVQSGECERGILLCGTGIGMSVVANKFDGVRAALCHDAFTAAASREHNDANILVMGARVLEQRQIREIADIWLHGQFAGGRHQLRLNMIAEIEKGR
ncbi:MAG: ribose 5-phosphate isomerase B [Bacillota bacterium]|nr:ribose 5-phosphate isomerase B [Bacillota bacterium]